MKITAHTKKKGFTLIEMMVAIVVIIGAVVWYVCSKSSDKSETPTEKVEQTQQETKDHSQW